ncbi:MAG TPA: ATP-dependent sacrificial sulfur transferase LarE [Acidobacteriaceae bacterium]|nr:ATP-dependent sacrificial sulfur transferase LarE [Acidobacteriaceae bacterium]
MKIEHGFEPAMEASQKQSRLEERIRELGSVLVAYSGGIDSAYLAYIAHRVLGDQMLAILADSASLSRAHFADALRFAEEHSIPLQVLATAELDDPEYVKNDATRCFHCKDELFSVMEKAHRGSSFQHLAYGMNVDDRGEYRPGQQAATAHCVLAPLAEAGLTKQEIRTLAMQAGLRIWDKPASACLSSRVEYGRPVTREVLQQVEDGEALLHTMGFRQFRVRYHGEMVRIEIAREEMPRALNMETMDRMTAGFRALGFKYVTLDCEGYRSGSMNAILPVEAIRSVNLQ